MGRGAASSVRAQDKNNDAALVFTLSGCLPRHHNNDQANSDDALSHWTTTTLSQAIKHDRLGAISKWPNETKDQNKAQQTREQERAPCPIHPHKLLSFQ